VIAFSTLVMPLEFIALWRTSIILHPQADTRTCWRILGETPGRSAGSGERSRTAQNEVRQVDGKRTSPPRWLPSLAGFHRSGTPTTRPGELRELQLPPTTCHDPDAVIVTVSAGVSTTGVSCQALVAASTETEMLLTFVSRWANVPSGIFWPLRPTSQVRLAIGPAGCEPPHRMQS